MRPASTSEFCLFRCLNRYLNEYSFKLLENMCDVTPLTSAIDSGGSEKEKKSAHLFYGLWLSTTVSYYSIAQLQAGLGSASD